ISHPYISFKKITVFRKDVMRCSSLMVFLCLLAYAIKNLLIIYNNLLIQKQPGVCQIVSNND
ncbi:hypothetical protein ACXOKJ_13450, partial [Streptococcus thermophilus]